MELPQKIPPCQSPPWGIFLRGSAIFLGPAALRGAVANISLFEGESVPGVFGGVLAPPQAASSSLPTARNCFHAGLGLHFRPWPAWGKEPGVRRRAEKSSFPQVFQHCLPLHNTRFFFLSLSLLVSPLFFFMFLLAAMNSGHASFHFVCSACPSARRFFTRGALSWLPFGPELLPVFCSACHSFLCSLFLLCATNSGHASLFSPFFCVNFREFSV